MKKILSFTTAFVVFMLLSTYSSFLAEKHDIELTFLALNDDYDEINAPTFFYMLIIYFEFLAAYITYQTTYYVGFFWFDNTQKLKIKYLTLGAMFTLVPMIAMQFIINMNLLPRFINNLLTAYSFYIMLGAGILNSIVFSRQYEKHENKNK